MTYPDPYAGLDLTPLERAQLAAAEQEAEWQQVMAGARAGGGDDDGDELPPEGPWDDVAGQLGAIGDQVDGHYAAEGQRIGEDIVAELDRRPSSEGRLARAMPRIEAGTYTQDAWFRGDEAAAAAAARDPLGRYQAACGPLDEFARCSSRYHTLDCHTTIESAAARGSAEDAEAWRDTLAGRAQPPGTDARSLGLANEPQPGDGMDVWSDLLEGPAGPADPRLHDRVLAYMGEIDNLPPEPAGQLPDVTVIRAVLGI